MRSRKTGSTGNGLCLFFRFFKSTPYGEYSPYDKPGAYDAFDHDRHDLPYGHTLIQYLGAIGIGVGDGVQDIRLFGL